jgi:hypothetical protein
MGHVLENVLYPIPDEGKATLRELMELDGQVGTGKKGGRCVSCLGVSFLGPGEDQVSSMQSGMSLGQGEQRSAGADLDIIRVRADRQHSQRLL